MTLRSRSNERYAIRRIAGKIGPLAFRLSRSLTVIGTDADISVTYDYLFVIHSNRVPISYSFRAKGGFRSKIANFPTQCVLNAPLTEFALKFC